MLPANHVPPPSRLSTSLNFIYGVTESPSNSEVQSQYSGASSEISDEAPTQARPQAYRQVFGNLRSKSNVRISEENNTYEESDQHSSVMKSASTSHGSQRHMKSASTVQMSVPDDLQTEIGSRAASEAGDSGNEADVETDFITLSPRSRQSEKIAGPEEKHRDFAKAMSERLVQAALLAGAKDNITVMVILLSAAAV